MNRWRVLVVDDDPEIAKQTAEIIESSPVSAAGEYADVEVTSSFEEALTWLEQRHYDLVILDIRDQTKVSSSDVEGDGDDPSTSADVGLVVSGQVRAARFVPILFYSAVAHLVSDVRPPFVAAVSKNDSIQALRDQVRIVFDSNLPAIHQALVSHVESVTREFMSGFVEKHWVELQAPPRKGDVAHLLSRRLAVSLADGGAVLGARLNDDPGVEFGAEHVHPMRLYIVPPVGDLTAGDILVRPGNGVSAESRLESQERATTGHQDEWYAVLTPACDLVTGRVKAEYVVVARCVAIHDHEEYRTWQSKLEQNLNAEAAQKKLLKLMANNRDGQLDRNYYLPGAWTVPDLVVDFQRVEHIPYTRIGEFRRVAGLDSPYVEALIAKHVRYLGRVGTPDLDYQVPIDRLRRSINPANGS
jgi:CheY-like chemotaxis protein